MPINRSPPPQSTTSKTSAATLPVSNEQALATPLSSSEPNLSSDTHSPESLPNITFRNTNLTHFMSEMRKMFHEFKQQQDEKYDKLFSVVNDIRDSLEFLSKQHEDLKLEVKLNFDSLNIIYFSLAQSVLGYCLVVWGGTHKTTMLRVERGQRAILKVLAKKPIRYPTKALYSLCQVLTVRQLFVLQAILRKHCQLAYDPSIFSTKRRSDRFAELKRHADTLNTLAAKYIIE
ncbi:hypothetical protein SFRURICE_021152 [Spodoptera frugiperda]|nr:hypothetical protein SFRURICE_021152 [Spodoptera frugiperda]